MPTYDYKCNSCNDQFEAFQKMSDEPLQTCEKCGGEVKRVITGGTGIIFKGSGFYVNDYKGNKSSSSAGSSVSSDAKSSSAPCCSGAACPNKNS